jgi:hypothetical protein
MTVWAVDKLQGMLRYGFAWVSVFASMLESFIAI